MDNTQCAGGSGTKEPGGFVGKKGGGAQTPGNVMKNVRTNSLDTFTQYNQILNENDNPQPKKKSHFFTEANTKSPKWIIEESKESESIMFCGCGKLCKQSFNMCEDCIAEGNMYDIGGYLYLKRDQTNLDRYWFHLVNKELYCKIKSNNRVQK